MANGGKLIKIETNPVYAPTLGIIGNIPPTMLDPRAFTKCNNIRLKDGVASKRTGYVAYGTGNITGIPLLLYGYQQFDLTEYEILVTTTNVYYRSGAGAWTSLVGSLNGTVTNRCSLAFIENHMVFTNGVDAPSKCLGTTWSALSDGAATNWATYRPKIFVPYKERLLGFNDNVSGSETGIREIHSVLGDFDNVNDTGAGFNDFTRGMGNEIVGAAELKDYVAVYKNLSCCLLDYIGGASLYSLNAHVQGIGLAAPHAIANLGTSHIFLGSDYNVHEWNGGWELNHIGDPIKKMLQAEINTSKLKRCFTVVNLKEKEVHLYIVVTGQDYPTVFYTYNLDDRSWVRNSLPEVSGLGQLCATAGGRIFVSGAEKTLIGGYFPDTSAGGCLHYDYSSSNDVDTAISAEFETGDFVLDKKQHMKRYRKYFGIGGDVKGSSTSAKLTIQHSDDEGVTYTTISEKTLTAVYDWTKWDFLKSARKLRFKFKDATIGQRFYVRYYGLEQKEGAIG